MNYQGIIYVDPDGNRHLVKNGRWYEDVGPGLAGAIAAQMKATAAVVSRFMETMTGWKPE